MNELVDGWTVRTCVHCGEEYDMPPYGISDEQTCDTCGEFVVE